MAEYENSAPGARGVNTTDGRTTWIDPGATAEIADGFAKDQPLPDGVTVEVQEPLTTDTSGDDGSAGNTSAPTDQPAAAGTKA